ESPTFSPPTRRSTAPVACNSASSRVVLPALVGPTRAKARTDPAGCIGIVVLPLARPPARPFPMERIHGAVIGRSRTGPGPPTARQVGRRAREHRRQTEEIDHLVEGCPPRRRATRAIFQVSTHRQVGE